MVHGLRLEAGDWRSGRLGDRGDRDTHFIIDTL